MHLTETMPLSTETAAAGWPRLDEPLIVLTGGRSGSTLLRFILDAHPQLACPPETGILDLSVRMGMLWKLLDGPAARDRPGLSESALTAIQSWMAITYGAYLAAQGKRRWCDKSLGSAELAGRFLDLFPKAKFICLYRHCMDVIDSMLEACPFGLTGYGIDTFAIANPGNNVAAIADYWVCCTRAIRAFEAAHPDKCVAVRYEDLVADPGKETARIFEFAGEEPLANVAEMFRGPGIAQFGPADHKIWATRGIRRDSVGRGIRLPWRVIQPPVLAMVNDLLEQLRYDTVKEGWGEQSDAIGLSRARAAAEQEPDGGPAADALLDEVETLLRARTSRYGPSVTAGQGGNLAADGRFSLTATLPAVPAARTWDVDLLGASVTRHTGTGRVASNWGVRAPAGVWHAVLTGQLNAATALRQGRLRYTDSVSGSASAEDPGAVGLLQRADPRAGLLARFLA